MTYIDMLGSLRATVDASGNEDKQYYYYPYGERKDVTYSGESTRQGFIGKEHDSELGLAEHGV